MRPSHPFIAIGAGAVIALSPLGTAAQTVSPNPVPTEPTLSPQTAPDAIAPNGSAPSSSTLGSPAQDTSETDTSSPPSVVPSPDPETATPSSPASETIPPSPSTPDSSAPEISPETPTPTSPAPPDSEAATSAPEYLNPNPNPLQFPTQPEEVRIVGTQPITLQQALELAQRNDRELQVAQLELERNRAALRQQQAANLPTVDVGASLTAAENQQQSNPLSTNQDAINTTLGGSVQLNYDLFTSGQRSSSIRAAERQVRFQELQVEIAAEQLRLDVTNLYYDLQDADQQVEISRSSLEEAQRSLRDAEAQERAGIGTRFDVLQAQVDVANSQQELTQNISDQGIARRQLAQRLSLAQTMDISAADPVEVENSWNLSLEDSIVLAYRNRAELEQQLVQREISDNQRRAALAVLGPQISLTATYNVQDSLNGTTNSTLNSSNSDFTDTYQVVAQASLRLFDGGSARANADQQEANIAIAETQFANARDTVRFQVEQAYLSLQANFDNIQTASLALQQATESLRLARLRFQAGVGTQSDVLRAQTELTRAQVNQLEAVLGYNRSLVSLQRAISNLPASNLAETP